MRFTCPRGELHRGIQIAARAVPSRTPIAILQNLLIRASPDGLRLTAYDQEVGIEVGLPAMVETPGEVTVPAKLLGEVVADLPDEPVLIEADAKNMVTVRCQKAEFGLAGLGAEDFPRLPEVGTDVRLGMPAPLFREIMQQTLFSVSAEDSKAALTGVYFASRPDQLVAVSTDTHRLSLREANPPELQGEATVILPARALEQFTRSIPSDTSENVEVCFSTTQARLSCREMTVVSRLIDAAFPNYERVIPSSYQKLLLAEREPLLRAVRRVSILARAEKSNRIVLRTREGVLQLSAESGGLGRAYEEVSVEHEGEELELAFNAEYLREILGVLTGATVRLEVGGHLTPCVVRSEGDVGFRHILMPMQIA